MIRYPTLTNLKQLRGIKSAHGYKWPARIRWFGYQPCDDNAPPRRKFVAYFHFVGWDCLEAGFHIALSEPNVELHVPFGFFRLGWQVR